MMIEALSQQISTLHIFIHFPDSSRSHLFQKSLQHCWDLQNRPPSATHELYGFLVGFLLELERGDNP